MPIWKAVLLGLVQGIAEFLPISSSGHLIIIKKMLGVDLESGGTFFNVMLHLGTLFAIIFAFRKQVGKLIIESIRIIIDIFANFLIFFKRFADRKIPYCRIVKSSYRKFAILIVVSSIPTAIIGIFMSEIVEIANDMIIVPGICMLITAIFLLIADILEIGDKKPRDVSYGNAVAVGVAQGLSTMPGISRSGTTITAGLLCGFDKKFAVQYSFIMSIPAVVGAGILELRNVKNFTMPQSDIIVCVIATVIAGLSGYVAICLMLALVKGRKYKYFSLYCVIVAFITMGYYYFA